MHSEYHKIRSIPLKVFFDQDIIRNNNKLPSEQRNIDIIRGIKFGELLQYIGAKKEKEIILWLNNHEQKLKEYLKKKKKYLETQKSVEYCRQLNYILDFVIQALKNIIDSNQFFTMKKFFDEKSSDVLRSNTSIICQRILGNSEDKNLYIKKIMYDLLEDIEYMLSVQNTTNHTQCSKMIDRINYRREILRDIYVTVSDKNIFNFDGRCKLSIIDDKIGGLSCIKSPIISQTLTFTEAQPVAEEQPITESPPFTPLPRLESNLLASSVSEDGEGLLGFTTLKFLPTQYKPELVEFESTEQTSPSEAEPNLNPTYAAASLAGVSLFGTILYKYTPFGSWLDSRIGPRNRSDIFPLYNNVNDASIMNNFEYLQTGIPNNEYEFGYGPVTDY